MPAVHVAQVNIARLRAPLDSPQLADFVAALEPVNALADGTPGFVWRLQDETGDATSIRGFDSDEIIVNLSVWASLDALWRFAYDSTHLTVMRRRREWFERIAGIHLTLWWVPAGHVPTVAEAELQVAHLARHGPSVEAFDFKTAFLPDGRPTTGARGERVAC